MVSVDGSTITADWGNLTGIPVNIDTDSTDDFDGAWGSLSGIPADIADGDDDTQYTAGTGIAISGTNQISVDGNTIPAGAIDGTKVVPNFGSQNIITTGNLTVNGPVTVGGTPVHPDYVFQKYFLGNSILKENYDFQTLAQIEIFVKKYHHLPGIKSAKEVQKDGFWNLSESNLQNLEKIEELFLHTIEQEKKIDQLKNENQSITEELETLKKEIEAIKYLIKEN